MRIIILLFYLSFILLPLIFLIISLVNLAKANRLLENLKTPAVSVTSAPVAPSVCPRCGSQVQGAFCMNCGNPIGGN